MRGPQAEVEGGICHQPDSKFSWCRGGSGCGPPPSEVSISSGLSGEGRSWGLRLRRQRPSVSRVSVGPSGSRASVPCGVALHPNLRGCTFSVLVASDHCSEVCRARKALPCRWTCGPKSRDSALDIKGQPGLWMIGAQGWRPLRPTDLLCRKSSSQTEHRKCVLASLELRWSES